LGKLPKWPKEFANPKGPNRPIGSAFLGRSLGLHLDLALRRADTDDKTD
jgi:hypothetical protein